MFEKKIKIEKEYLLSLTGPQDKYLKAMNKELDSKIYLSNNEIIIRGENNDNIIASEAINDFLMKLKNKVLVTDINIENYIKEYFGNNFSKNTMIITPEKKIFSKTEGQKKYITSMNTSELTICIGPAGTGKTFLAIAKAVELLMKKDVKKIILTRPAVEAGENLGFLPGDFIEKVQPYLRPLYDSLSVMLSIERMKKLIELGTIEVAPLAFMRGRTLNNACIILDEAQNTTAMQMKMFLTRLGANSRTIVCGDITQSDLIKEKSGLFDISKLLKYIIGIKIVYLNESDIVRHRLVRDILVAYKLKNCDE